jgi:formylglycine-generating enzyme required for sulfatase activity
MTLANAMKLEHPGIARVYKFGELGEGKAYFAMEYLEGPSIEERIHKEGALSLDEFLPVALKMASALDYAHREGVVHGNLNPAKFIFHRKEWKMVDFGILLLDSWPIPITPEELPFLDFMPPELLHHSSTPQIASDIYSLCMTFYYMLTAESPHPVDMEKVPPSFCPILKKATESNPNLRYPSATQLAADISNVEKSGGAVSLKTEARQLPSRRPAKPQEELGIALPEKYVYQNGAIYCSLDNSVMVLVSAGVFTMGSDHKDAECPVHEVFLSDYLMDKYPVTNAQYGCFLEYLQTTGDHSKCHPNEVTGKDHIPRGWKTPDYEKYSKQDNSPVIFIDWWDAYAYASWAQKSLPTEAQWEKGARGTDVRKYPWGDEEPTEAVANYNNYVGEATPVGSFPKNASSYGSMDMAGNVWEWCLETYNKNFYRQSNKENPRCNLQIAMYVLRGGAWNSGRDALRVSCRNCSMNLTRASYIGFRCVRLL